MRDDCPDLIETLQALYASKINAGVQSHADGHFIIRGRLGDPLNGFDAKRGFGVDELELLAQWLRQRAIEHYPDSRYAGAHRAQVIPWTGSSTCLVPVSPANDEPGCDLLAVFGELGRFKIDCWLQSYWDRGFRLLLSGHKTDEVAVVDLEVDELPEVAGLAWRIACNLFPAPGGLVREPFAVEQPKVIKASDLIQRRILPGISPANLTEA